MRAPAARFARSVLFPRRLLACRQLRRATSFREANPAEQRGQHLAYLVVTIVGSTIGFYMLKTTIGGGKAQAPFDVMALRDDLETVLDKHNCAPELLRLCWQACAGFDLAAYRRDGEGGRNRGTVGIAPQCSNDGCKDVSKLTELLKPIAERHGMSMADLVVFAGCVSILAMDGPHVPFSFGRVDGGPEHCVQNGAVPDAAMNSEELRSRFYRMGLNDRELVALVGSPCLTHPGSRRTRAPHLFRSPFIELLLREWAVSKKDKDGGPLLFKDAEDRKCQLVMQRSDVALKEDSMFHTWCQILSNDGDWRPDFVDAFRKIIEAGWVRELHGPISY